MRFYVSRTAYESIAVITSLGVGLGHRKHDIGDT
jgi:hypothetical protein